MQTFNKLVYKKLQWYTDEYYDCWFIKLSLHKVGVSVIAICIEYICVAKIILSCDHYELSRIWTLLLNRF